ncbi:lysophosphatidylserine lipase ABHD12 isoform X2 [Pygocentrus nattereri]|uniref:lysophosphatidylserine lipase ABHD12 isoform X2 n=1 Tax=Pygocentrus nattereri TaxID=42514 RepID=UPI001891CB05|nr:lysophosphatidylserine lipase ABHD12 isoform X2 [Pygocentrus nattereri]
MRRRVDEAVGLGQAKEKSIKGKAGEVQVWSLWRLWLKWTLLALCVLYVVTPFLLRLFPGIVQHLVYSHGILYFVDLSRPADLGLNHTANMYLTPEEGVTLGVWHTVPEKKWKEAQGKGLDWYEKSLGDGSPVFIYLHGNTNNRATPHRIATANVSSSTLFTLRNLNNVTKNTPVTVFWMLQVISSLGYHAVVMDYRGFGDSTGEPTGSRLIIDALYLYHWVRERSKGSPLVIWGHSIGTVVTTNLAVKLQEQGNPADGVILEGAFTHTLQKRYAHPFAWYYWKFPYIQYYFLSLPKEKKAPVPNDENLKKMRTPLLMLHAEDDQVAPFKMAQELYSIAREALKSDKRIKLVSFERSLRYGHDEVYRDPALPGIVREFVQTLAA